ncbi:MAG: GUN4 domain-containing protein [Microcoleaceae cyanobacterium]
METFLGHILRPFSAFLTGIITGSLVTVYGTLTHVDLFDYIESDRSDLLRFYGDLLGVSGKFFQSKEQFDGYLNLGISANAETLEIYALPNSVCKRAIVPGDRAVIQAQGSSSLLPDPQSVNQQPPLEQLRAKLEKISAEGVGTLEITGTQGTAKLEINLLTETQTCIRKSQAIQQLEQLLKAKRWKDADLKTYEIMLAVTNRKAVGYLDKNSIETFPCAELKTINQLWEQESGGLWGFRIQKEIYEKAGNSLVQEELKLYNLDAYVQFSDLVRWIESGSNGKENWKPYDKLTISLDAPEGHLPRLEKLEDGLEKTRPGYRLMSSKALPLSSQEIQARNLFFARIAACGL